MAGDVDQTSREKLMQALLGGQNHSEAARTSGYSRKHVKELVRQPAFARELERRRAALPSEQESDPETKRLEKLSLDTLEEIAADESQPGTARVAAAKELRAHAKERKGPRATVPTNQDPTEVASPARRESATESAARYGFKLAK